MAPCVCILHSLQPVLTEQALGLRLHHPFSWEPWWEAVHTGREIKALFRFRSGPGPPPTSQRSGRTALLPRPYPSYSHIAPLYQLEVTGGWVTSQVD